MRQYEEAELMILAFMAEDIITESNGDDFGDVPLD